jgi:hypothetical protein
MVVLAGSNGTPVEHPTYSPDVLHVIFWHWKYLNMSYEVRNSALTFKLNKPLPLPYARCQEMAYCTFEK